MREAMSEGMSTLIHPIPRIHVAELRDAVVMRLTGVDLNLFPEFTRQSCPGRLQELDCAVPEHDALPFRRSVPHEFMRPSDFLRQAEMHSVRVLGIRALVRNPIIHRDHGTSGCGNAFLRCLLRCGALPEFAVDEQEPTLQFRQDALGFRDLLLALINAQQDKRDERNNRERLRYPKDSRTRNATTSEDGNLLSVLSSNRSRSIPECLSGRFRIDHRSDPRHRPVDLQEMHDSAIQRFR